MLIVGGEIRWLNLQGSRSVDEALDAGLKSATRDGARDALVLFFFFLGEPWAWVGLDRQLICGHDAPYRAPRLGAVMMAGSLGEAGVATDGVSELKTSPYATPGVVDPIKATSVHSSCRGGVFA